MTCRTILQWPDKKLAEKSTPCGPEITDDIIQNVTDVVDTLKTSFGVGLAAPQVGIHKRIVAIAPSVVELENPYPQEQFPDHLVLIDPELELSGKTFVWNEACLSVPFVTSPIKRSSLTKLKFTNLKGERVEIDCVMPLSGVLQHECDHLDGILFIDRAGRFVKDKLAKKLKKEKRLKKREEEAVRRQLILDTQGAAGLRKYLADKNPSKRKQATRKRSGKSYGKNKKRR